MWKCKHCQKEFEGLNPSEKANHSRWCDNNPKKEEYLIKLGKTRNKISEESRLNQSRKVKIAWEKGAFDNIKHDGFKGKTHTLEVRKRISEGQKKWIKNNPEKHVWNISKNKSAPCEEFKSKLRNLGFQFEEEYMPLFPERYFSIDIAFPEIKLGVEINGNQHYYKNGELKEYYKERHFLIEKAGWKLIELPFKEIYKDDIIERLYSLTG